MIEWILVAIVVAIVGYVVLTYNTFINLRQMVKNGWAQIDVQLKMRADLIPNLVETVKGYAKHEKTVFKDVTAARSAILSAKTPAEAAKANDMLTGALKSLFAVAEAYPQLKANENFLQLQDKLSDVEQKIAYARQFYNDTVMKLNRLVLMFPSNLIANAFGFKEEEYFKVAEGEKKAPKVKFE